MSILILFLTMGSQCIFAQYAKEYKALSYSYKPASKNKALFMKKINAVYVPLAKEKQIVSAYKDYLFYLHQWHGELSKSKAFIADTTTTHYLQRVLDSVMHLNGIQTNYEVVLTRFSVANAFNMGDYRLYINIGLFKCLDNEAQLAYVICHELAHKMLNHAELKFIAKQKEKDDKKKKKEIRSIERAKYNKLDRAVNYARQNEYNYAQYSRVNEYQADSLALVLMMKSNYDLKEIKQLFENLDASDSINTPVPVVKFFNNETYQINTEWLNDSEYKIDFGNASLYEFDKDSLKTHPDMKNRYEKVDSLLLVWKYVEQDKKKYILSDSVFKHITFCADFEELEILKLNKRYASIIFHAMDLVEKYPHMTYLHKTIAENLKNIYTAFETHKLHKHIPLESEQMSDYYKELLRIIYHCSLNDYKLLCKAYCDNYKNELATFSDINNWYHEISK
ncbi:MAG: M48 family metalloprotease [Chitinophagaceae bacterium]